MCYSFKLLSNIWTTCTVGTQMPLFLRFGVFYISRLTSRGTGCDYRHWHTQTDMLPYTRTCRATIATPVMSAGPVVCDVISLSCLVSVLAYSQVYSSVERRAVKTGPNQPRLNLHSSLHLSCLLTLLYKIILQTCMVRVVITTQQHPPPQQCAQKALLPIVCFAMQDLRRC